MKFSCEKALLSAAVSVASRAVAAKSSIPAMEGILVEAGTELRLTGYNLETGIQAQVPSEIIQTGSLVLPARLFGEIVRNLPDDVVVVSSQEYTVHIQCGPSKYKILATDAEEFPELPSVDQQNSLTISQSVLRSMIGQTLFAVSDNESRPVHTGSLFEIEGESLTVVSVDGYRLAMSQEEIQNPSGRQLSFVAPGETLKEVSRILPDSDDELIHIYPERKHALFEIDGALITTRLLEGEFLNYRNAIPTDCSIRLEIDVKSIINCVERVSLIISERLKNPIRCCFEDESLKISCVTSLGRAYDECPIPKCPEKIEIGFNNRYLLDALRACPEDKVMLELKSSLSPCVIRPVEGEKFLYLVLPVRLKAEA